MTAIFPAKEEALISVWQPSDVFPVPSLTKTNSEVMGVDIAGPKPAGFAL